MIPSKFKILGHEIEVVIDNIYCHHHECQGRFLEWDNKIILADRFKTARSWRKYKKSVVEHTFYHELAHCLLYYTGNKIWLNEQLVDTVGGLLHQYNLTKE
jgi:hypothetical protein